MTSDNAVYATEAAETGPAVPPGTADPENASAGGADRRQQPVQSVPDDSLHALRQVYERRRS